MASFIVIFICMILVIKAYEYLPQPTLSLSSTDIRDQDSVMLDCVILQSITVSKCYFYIKGKTEWTTVSPCNHSFTGSQMLRETGQHPPAEVTVQCKYSASGWQFESIYSEPVSVKIKDQPTMTVIPSMLKMKDTVELTCQYPTHVSISLCYLVIVGARNPLPSCAQTFTGAYLLQLAGLTSPAQVKVKCYYYASESKLQSSFSDVISVEVLGPPSPSLTVRPEMTSHTAQKPTISVNCGETVDIVCELPGSATNDTSCNFYLGEEVNSFLTSQIMKRKSPGIKQWFCKRFVSKEDLLRRLESVRPKKVSCDYRHGTTTTSPRSDGHILTCSNSSQKSPIPFNTIVKPTEDLSSAPFIVLVSETVTPTGSSSASPTLTSSFMLSLVFGLAFGGVIVGVILIGMTAYVHRKINKTFPKGPRTGIDDHLKNNGLSMGVVNNKGMAHVETTEAYNLITSVISSDLPTDNRPPLEVVNKKSMAHVGNTEAYSLITSVSSSGLPLGIVRTSGRTYEYDDSKEYHVYHTIADNPVTSAHEDMRTLCAQ